MVRDRSETLGVSRAHDGTGLQTRASDVGSPEHRPPRETLDPAGTFDLGPSMDDDVVANPFEEPDEHFLRRQGAAFGTEFEMVS